MAGVRVLVGTAKGAFILTSDENRTKWEISEPQLPGAEVYHIKGSPLNPDLIWASQPNDWFGQLMHFFRNVKQVYNGKTFTDKIYWRNVHSRGWILSICT